MWRTPRQASRSWSKQNHSAPGPIPPVPAPPLAPRSTRGLFYARCSLVVRARNRPTMPEPVDPRPATRPRTSPRQRKNVPRSAARLVVASSRRPRARPPQLAPSPLRASQRAIEVTAMGRSSVMTTDSREKFNDCLTRGPKRKAVVAERQTRWIKWNSIVPYVAASSNDGFAGKRGPLRPPPPPARSPAPAAGRSARPP
jgi:hypothetical protein